jgi:hypothetical protein
VVEHHDGGTLPAMSSPELSRRVDRHEDGIRAVSDTVLDIKETVDGLAEVQQQHTATLAEHGRDLGELKASVGELQTTVASHTEMLTEILALLRDR